MRRLVQARWQAAVQKRSLAWLLEVRPDATLLALHRQQGGHGADDEGRRESCCLGVAGAAAAIAAVVASTKRRRARCEQGQLPESQELPFSWSSDTSALWRRQWQDDWDGRAPPSSSSTKGEKEAASNIKTQGRCRHLLFIRHGQYEMNDVEHGLTELGRKQSRMLGERLAQMSGKEFKDLSHEYPIRFAGIWSSDLPRARQTAEILAEALPDVVLHPADPVLAEGKPAATKPGHVNAAMLWEDSARIEYAFRHYIHRDVDHKRLAEKEAKEEKKRRRAKVESDYVPESNTAPEATPEVSSTSKDEASKAKAESEKARTEHVFEIVVCHGNVIRYFLMRALQLPPEAWLRLGGYNTGITEIVIQPNGKVQLIRFADTGHLPLEMTTFH